MIKFLNLLYKPKLPLLCLLFSLQGCSSKEESTSFWRSESKAQLKEFILSVNNHYDFEGEERDIFANAIATKKISTLNEDAKFLSQLRLGGYDKFVVYADGSILISSFKYSNNLRMFDGFLYSKFDVLNMKRNGFSVTDKLGVNWYYVQFSD